MQPILRSQFLRIELSVRRFLSVRSLERGCVGWYDFEACIDYIVDIPIQSISGKRFFTSTRDMADFTGYFQGVSPVYGPDRGKEINGMDH